MFLAPWFLLGLLAAAVPAVIHLRRSRRMERIVFSTNRFFDEAFIRASRQAKLHDRLMMLLRMLLLMLLALALAQPLLRLPQLTGLAGTGRVVAIVIDDSASMNRTTDVGSSFELAKAAAITIIDELSASNGDQATIILAGWSQERTADNSQASSETSSTQPSTQNSRVLFTTPSSDFAAIRKAILDLKPTDLGTDLSGAVTIADKTITPLAGSAWHKTREIYVLSDLQSTAFTGPNSLTPGPGTGLYLVSLAPSPKDVQANHTNNLAIDALQYDAPHPMIGVPFTFRALVVNHSQSPKLARLNLIVDDQIAAYKTITLQPARSQIVRLEYRFTQPGWHAGRVQILPQDVTMTQAVDALPADNHRHFALNVLPGLKILAINGSPSAVATQDELFFLRLALTSHDSDTASNQRIELTQIAPDQLTESLLQDHGVVILANVASLTPDALDALEKHIDQGAGLLITLGNQTLPATYNPWSSAARNHQGLLPAVLGNSVQQDVSIQKISPDHAVTAGFFTQRYGDLSNAQYKQFIELTPLPHANVLLSTANENPLLLERPYGRGNVMLYASTIDRDWNNQPLQPAFVPLMLRIASHLAQGGLQRSGFFSTGQSILLPDTFTPGNMTAVELPDHVMSYLNHAPSTGSDAATRFEDTQQAGVYSVFTRENQPASLMFATNIPPEESIVLPVTKDDMTPFVAANVPWVFIESPGQMDQATRLARQGTSLWQQFLLIVLLIAVCEPWLANRWTQWRSSSVKTTEKLKAVAPAVSFKPSPEVHSAVQKGSEL